jgi:hypothetical protein
MDQNRKHILPELMKFACDPNIDAMTRSWVFDALRDISGEKINDDPEKWRRWYASVSNRPISGADANRALISAAWLQP